MSRPVRPGPRGSALISHAPPQARPVFALEPVFTGEQVRAAETPLLERGRGEELMRKAAWALAQHMLALLQQRGRVYGAVVTGLIGPGNNGGDGLWALSFLRSRGVDAQAVLVRGRAHQQALQAFLAAGGRVTDQVDDDADLLLDAILGTGFQGQFEIPGIPGLSGWLDSRRGAVVACDVPSGVDAGTGAVAGEAMAADHTVTFGGTKTGALLGEGGTVSGQVHTVDIGLGDHLPHPAALAVIGPVSPREDSTSAGGASNAERRLTLRSPEPGAHKYSRGVVSVIAGSPQYPGAAQLTVGGALTTGVGMAALHAPEDVAVQVLARWPETVRMDEDALARNLGHGGAAVIGPGIGEAPEQTAVARRAIGLALEQQAPCVIDASGLALIDGPLGAEAVITPHLGEARTLTRRLGLDDVGHHLGERPDLLAGASGLAQVLNAVVVLKGPTTVVAAPDGRPPLIHRAQTPGLSTAGTGDVLAGILGAVLTTQRSTGERTDRLAALAVALHAERARRIDPHGHGEFSASALVS